MPKVPSLEIQRTSMLNTINGVGSVLRRIGLDPFRMVSSLPRMWRVLREQRPDVVVSTGSEIAIPVFYLAKLLGMKTVFIETCSRVQMPTGTGRLVYPISDVFLVQWPEMLSSYGPKAQYKGGLL